MQFLLMGADLLKVRSKIFFLLMQIHISIVAEISRTSKQGRRCYKVASSMAPPPAVSAWRCTNMAAASAGHVGLPVLQAQLAVARRASIGRRGAARRGISRRATVLRRWELDSDATPVRGSGDCRDSSDDMHRRLFPPSEHPRWCGGWSWGFALKCFSDFAGEHTMCGVQSKEKTKKTRVKQGIRRIFAPNPPGTLSIALIVT